MRLTVFKWTSGFRSVFSGWDINLDSFDLSPRTQGTYMPLLCTIVSHRSCKQLFRNHDYLLLTYHRRNGDAQLGITNNTGPLEFSLRPVDTSLYLHYLLLLIESPPLTAKLCITPSISLKRVQMNFSSGFVSGFCWRGRLTYLTSWVSRWDPHVSETCNPPLSSPPPRLSSFPQCHQARLQRQWLLTTKATPTVSGHQARRQRRSAADQEARELVNLSLQSHPW